MLAKFTEWITPPNPAVGNSEEQDQQDQQRAVAVNGTIVHEDTKAGLECSHYYSSADIDVTDGSTAFKHSDDHLCKSVCVLQNGYGPVPPPRRHSIATCKNSARSVNHHSVQKPPFEVPPPQDLRKCEEQEKQDKKMHYYSVPEYPVISPKYDRLPETPEVTASRVKPRYDKLKERPASAPVQNGVKHRYDQLSMPYSEKEAGSTPGGPKEVHIIVDQIGLVYHLSQIKPTIYLFLIVRSSRLPTRLRTIPLDKA